MTRTLYRSILLLAVLAVTVLLSAGLSPSVIETEEEPAHPEEVRLMEELAAWTGDSPTASADQPFPGVENLATSVQQYAESFSLFRQAAGPVGRAATLEAVPYGGQILRVAERHGVDPLLVAAIVFAESSYNPAALSPVGAQGLMQLMPDTAVDLGANPDEDLLAGDPVRNLELGTRYLKQLSRQYGGDLALVLAAYNSGPGNVSRYGGIPPFRETREYVERVLARYIDLHNSALAAETYELVELGSDLAAGS